MSLRHALLGFLAHRPLSGYDLKRAFDQSAAFFWTADKAQIYRTLAELQAAGQVEVERVPGGPRPDRKVQHLTPAGRAALDAWLRAPTDPPARREPFVLKLFLSDLLPPDDRAALIAVELERARAELAALEAIAAELRASPEPIPAGPALALLAGQRSAAAWVGFLEEAGGWASSEPAVGDPRQSP